MTDSKLPQRWVPAVPNGDPIAADIPVLPAQQSALRGALQLLSLLRRHWFLVAVIAAACVGTLLYKLRNQPHLYRAAAVVRIKDKGEELSAGLARAPTPSQYRMYIDPILSQVYILQSQAVAESVAEREGLRLRELPRWVPPRWARDVHVGAAPSNDTLLVSFQPAAATVRTRSGEARAQYGEPLSIDGVQFTVPRNPGVQGSQLIIARGVDAANDVRSNLSARPRERSDVIDVSYVADDPALAQRLANAAVREFQARSAQMAKEQSVLRRQFIAQQLEKSELLLAEARSAHNTFRTREKVFSTQDKFRAQQSALNQIDLRRQELIADRSTYASLLDTLQSAHGTMTTERLSALAASPGVATNTVVAQLFGQLVAYQSARDSITTGRWSVASTNPDVQRLDALIASAQLKVVNAVRANVSVIDARLGALAEEKTGVSSGMATLPQAEAEEATLLAQVQTYGRQVDLLRDQLQQAEIAEAAETGQVDIVDLATPGAPIGSSRKPKIILALLIGLIAGMGVAYILENYRPVIRRRDELEEALSLPNLAMVPQIRTASRTQGRFAHAVRFLPKSLRGANGNGNGHGGDRLQTELVTVSDIRSSGAEAYRTLRTNLLFSAAVRAVHRVVVTSPGPEEGKSTTAANLAIAFAQQGHRVLLIDCDLRRSRVHKIFDETQTPGLTNILIGRMQPMDVIRPTRIDGLMILPSGALPPNPAELLGSSLMSGLLDTLSGEFDIVILDTPPLLAASDAAIISRISDGALVVVRAGKTERSALQTAIQQLTTVGARVLGTVLNDPDAEVPKYARYYGYYYNNYYEYATNGNGTSA